MRRFGVAIVLCAGIAVLAPAGSSAQPPAPPPACTVVLTTPAATTGSEQGIAQKMAAYDFVCVP